MSHVWVEIESLVLDGVPMDVGKGQRFARLTEMALERLLRERGISRELTRSEAKKTKEDGVPAIKLSAGSNERQWAEELAQILYRELDRRV